MPFNATYSLTHGWEVSTEEDQSRVVEGLLGDCPAPRDTWRTEDGDLNMGIRDHA